MTSTATTLLLLAALAWSSAGHAQDAASTPARAAAAPTASAPAGPKSVGPGLQERTMWALSWGDLDELERLHQEAARATQPDEDGLPQMKSFMAGFHRLWDIGAPEATDAYFENLDAVTAMWLVTHRVKRGMRASVSRYPRTKAVNAFARLACLRGDRAAAQETMDRLGDEPDLDYRGVGTSGRSAFDQCRRWLSQRDTLPVPAPVPSGRPANTQS